MGKNTDMTTTSQTLLAKAVYDNIAETPDEIAFRRGDVLTVIETDTNGLEGWWLCSFRGKQGIAPGNRLKILTKVVHNENDTLKANKINLNDTQNKIVLPQKQGDVYNFPNRTVEDYDVPKSHQINNDLEDDGQPNYDTPNSRRESVHNTSNIEQSFYDTPPSNKSSSNSTHMIHDTSNQSFFGEVYDVPSNLSNRSSVLSNISHLSNESTMTVSSSLSNKSLRDSNPPSMCDSARSSMDISPHDFYDVPTSDPRPVNHHKQSSADSGLDLYDSPPKSKQMLSFDMEKELSSIKTDIHSETQVDYDVPKTDYDVPKPKHEPSENELVENIYNVPDPQYPNQTDDDIYDVPKSNMPLKKQSNNEDKNGARSKRGSSGVYDIPPQVTRDSMLSSKSDSSDSTDGGQRLSACSLDSRNSDIPVYDELPLDLDAAMDLMVKLQQDVQKSVTKLSGFVSSTWRVKENLEPNLYNIKVACLGVKSSLNEYLDFAQGALANSARLPDRKLINKIHKQLSPLQQTLSQVKVCLKNLEGIDWQLSSLVSTDSSKNDDLGQIASLSKDLTADVKKLTTLIHANSSLLFKRGSDVKSLVAVCDNYLHEVGDVSQSKPPIKPKPNVPIKPGNLTVQQRPLPPPPPKERPLPPTPTEKKSINFDDAQWNSGEFKRGSGEYKRLSAEFKRLSMELKAKNVSNEKSTKDIVEEYDYVQLEAKEAEEEEKEKANKKHNIDDDLDDKPVKESSIKNDTPSKESSPLRQTEENVDLVNSEADFDTLKTPVNRNSGSFNIPSPLTHSISLEPSDKQVLFFYSGQLDTHSTLLTNAIDAFFGCIECGEPPKVFISNSKFVVVSAHKLVYIGDSLCRNISNTEIKNKIMHCANHLCDCLKVAVTATKTAALQYPSVPAVQDMVDRITSVSHAACELKLLITQAASL